MLAKLHFIRQCPKNSLQTTDSLQTLLENEPTDTAVILTQSNGLSEKVAHKSVESRIKSATYPILVRLGRLCVLLKN